MHVWQPFVEDTNFNQDWWDDTWDLDEQHSLWSVEQDGKEVARLVLLPTVDYQHYAHVPDLGPHLLEVDFFEVARPARHQGVGAATMRLLTVHFPGRRLLAFSEEADGFWSSLGWDRYDHPDGLDLHRPLFVSPPRWPASPTKGHR